jgi:hypothetical protein
MFGTLQHVQLHFVCWVELHLLPACKYRELNSVNPMLHGGTIPAMRIKKVLIEKFAGYSANVGGVIAAVPGGMRWVLRSLTHRRYRPSRPCSC